PALVAANLHVRLSLGQLLVATGRAEEAQETYEQAATLSDGSLGVLSSRSSFDQELSRCYADLGKLLTASGKVEQAEKAFRRRAGIYEKLWAAPRAGAVGFRLTGSYFALADLLVSSGRPAEAEAVYKHGQTFLQARAAEHPDVTDYRHELGRVHNWRGIFLA